MDGDNIAFEGSAKVPVTGDCGHKYLVGINSINPDSDLTCPECGGLDRFTKEQVEAIRADYEAQI